MSEVRLYRDQRRTAASWARIKHLVTRWSQNNMHLLLFVPAPGLAHLPTQFAALFSHRGASIAACAGEYRSAAIPMRVIAKKRCRAIFEPPEKDDRTTLHLICPATLNLLLPTSLARRIGWLFDYAARSKFLTQAQQTAPAQRDVFSVLSEFGN
jgi:hypothetical protein